MNFKINANELEVLEGKENLKVKITPQGLYAGEAYISKEKYERCLNGETINVNRLIPLDLPIFSSLGLKSFA